MVATSNESLPESLCCLVSERWRGGTAFAALPKNDDVRHGEGIGVLQHSKLNTESDDKVMDVGEPSTIDVNPQNSG